MISNGCKTPVLTGEKTVLCSGHIANVNAMHAAGFVFVYVLGVRLELSEGDDEWAGRVCAYGVVALVTSLTAYRGRRPVWHS